MRRALFYLLPLVLAVGVRLSLPSYYEFEVQEDTVRTRAIIENGEIPLYGIGHVRFLGAALGPLVYYFKAIPYLLSEDPAWELLYLFLFHLAGMLCSMLLVGNLARALLVNGPPGTAPQGPESRRLSDWAAFSSGVLLALSTASQVMTSQGHASYYAAALQPVFLYAVFRYLDAGRRNRGAVGSLSGAAGVAAAFSGPNTAATATESGEPLATPVHPAPFRTDAAPGAPSSGGRLVGGWLLLAGACLGLSTQLYQMALFAPLLAAGFFLVKPCRPRLREIWLLCIPFALCYVPYLVSELATGFWNTRNFFSFQPGPQDSSMIGAPVWENVLFFLDMLVEHELVAPALDMVFLALAAVGLGVIAARTRLRWEARFAGLFFLIYVLAPALVLGAPRFELSLPLPQLLVVLGGGFVLGLCRRVWRGPRRLAFGLPLVGSLAALLAGSVLFGTTDADKRLRYPLFYPMRLVFSEPAGRSPTLGETREMAHELRARFGVGLEDFAARVHSPVLFSGYYGEHYLLRVAERENPGRGQSRSTLFVYDDLFPWELPGSTSLAAPWDVKALEEDRILRDSFTLQLSCDADWCAQRLALRSSPPAIRFFWGCGELRDLDDRLPIPPDECEELLLAPPHDRRYSGKLRLPPAEGPCEECREVLFVTVTHGCRVLVQLDGEPLPLEWVEVNERALGFSTLDPTLNRGVEHPLVVDILGCRPLAFDLVQFTGRWRGWKEDQHGRF
jgi:hypothetical protein